MSFNASLILPLTLESASTSTSSTTPPPYILSNTTSPPPFTTCLVDYANDDYETATKIKHLCRTSSCLGMLVNNFPPYSELSMIISSSASLLHTPIPVGVVSQASFEHLKALLQASSTTSPTAPGVWVVFEGWDRNVWREFGENGGRMAMFFVLTLTSLLCIARVVHKLTYMWILDGSLTFNLGSVCLLLEGTGNAFRTVYLMMSGIGPPSDGGEGGRLTTQQYNFITRGFYTFGFPFNLASGILMIFFWLDVTSKVVSLYSGGFLDAAFKPAVVLIVVCFVMCFTMGLLVMVGSMPLSILANIMSPLFAVVLAVSVIYFVAAFRLHRHASSMQKKQRDRLVRMTAIIVVSGVMIIVAILAALLSVMPVGIVIFYSALFLFDMASSTFSFLQIEVFGTGTKKNLRRDTSTSSRAARPLGGTAPLESDKTTE